MDQSVGSIQRKALWLVLILAVLLLGAAAGILKGTITKVDVGAGVFTIEDSEGKESRITVDDASVIVLDGDDQAIIDDLFEGDVVVSARVRELDDGRLLLVRAEITSPPASPDENEEGTETSAHPTR